MDLDDLDPAVLAWSMHTRIDVDAMPVGRTVIEFEFTGTPTDFRRFWLVVNDSKIDMCLKNPGYEPNLVVRADLRLFVEAWRGIRSLRREIKDGAIKLEGPSDLCGGFPTWLQLSALAPFEREYEGRERLLGAETIT